MNKKLKKTLLDTLAAWLNTPPFLKGGRGDFSGIAVAFSGGRDSTVLLHALNALFQVGARHDSPEKVGARHDSPEKVGARHDSPIEAWHVNHQLQPEASSWAEHCAAFCAHYNIPFRSFAVKIEQKSGDSLEALARTARYRVFKEQAAPGSVIVTAHHQQDNVETFLHHALRGAGVRGLRAIAPWKSLGQESFLARPLLEISTEQIAAYALEHGLTWIIDPSNQNQKFSRNFIRHEVLPSMQQHYPAAVACLSRTVRHCREAEDLLELLAQQDLAQMTIKTPYGSALRLEIFLEKTCSQQKNALRYWLKIQDILPPEDLQLSEFLRQLREAHCDKHPSLPCGEWILSTYQQHLYVYAPCYLENIQPSIELSKMEGGEVEVRYDEGGKRVKKHLQEGKVPPWMRKHIPLMYIKGVFIKEKDLP